MDPTSPLFIEYNDSGVFSCSFIPSGHFFPPAKAPSRLARRQSRPTRGKPALPPPRLPERRILWDRSYSVPQAARRGLQLPACNAPRRRRRATGPPSERHAGSCSLHHSPPPYRPNSFSPLLPNNTAGTSTKPPTNSPRPENSPPRRRLLNAPADSASDRRALRETVFPPSPLTPRRMRAARSRRLRQEGGAWGRGFAHAP